MLGQDVREYIANQFNTRQELYSNTNNRSNNQIQLLNNQNTWIKMASGVSLETDESGSLSPFAKEKLQDIQVPTENLENLKGTGLAKKFILFNGISSLSDSNSWNGLKNKTGFNTSNFLNSEGSYSKSDFGYVPMPGITDFNIKSLNMGSIKKATIKFKLHSKSQFDIFELLYLRLGYTVLIEFGNNIYTNDKNLNIKNTGQTLIEDKENGFFSDKFSQDRSYLDILKSIERLRENHSGNYGGFLGKVTNFEWSIDNLGSYDITLNLISLGDIIESLKINLPITKDFSKFLQQATTNGEEVTFKDQISSMLFAYRFLNDAPSTTNKVHTSFPKNNFWVGNKMVNDISTITTKTYKYTYTLSTEPNGLGYNGFNSVALIPTETLTDTFSQKQKDKGEPYWWNTRKKWHYVKKYMSTLWEEKDAIKIADKSIGNSDVKLTITYKREETTIENPCTDFELNDGFKTTQATPNFYIRLGALLKYIQENTIPTIKGKNSPTSTPIITIESDTNDYYKAGMYTVPNQLSLNPKVCIVRNKFVNYAKEDRLVEFYKELAPFSELDFNDQQKQTFSITQPSGEIKGEHLINPNRAYIQNIYLNHNFVENILTNNVNSETGDITPFTLLNDICSGINKALGGINNLVPVIDETTNTLSIIETTPIPNQSPLTPPTPYTLNLFGFDPQGKGNFIRKLDIKTTISPQYASMITVGTTSAGYVKGTNGTAFSKWNKGLTDRFKEKLDPPGNSSKNDTTTTTPTASLFPSEAAEQYYTQYLLQFPSPPDAKGNITTSGIMGYPNTPDFTPVKSYDQNIIEKNLSTVTEFYKYAHAKKTLDNPNSNGVAGGIGFIPFKMSFTMNGIEGIKIYNTLRVNSSFLPQAYGKTLNFIITGVDHSIKNNDWETTITTLVQPKSTTPDNSTSIENYYYIFTPVFKDTNFFKIFLSSTSTKAKNKPNTPGQTTSERNPEKAKGTTGTIGPTNDRSKLSPGALTTSEINKTIKDSGGKTSLRKRIVGIAASYVGQSELPGNNQGWHDQRFQDKLKKPNVTDKNWGWYAPQPWCAWFVSRVMYEAHVVGNSILGPGDDKSKSIWKNKYRDGAELKPFSAGVLATETYFKNTLKRDVRRAKAIKNPDLIQPGDIVYYNASHIGIVVKINKDSKGKLKSLDIVNGNTKQNAKNVNELRDGGTTALARNYSINKIRGFSRLFES